MSESADLFRPYVPEDFDEFWAEAQAEARSTRLDYHRSLRNDFDWPGFGVETLQFRGVQGETVHGWITYPPGARRLPSYLWIPPYGRESILPNRFSTREGFCTLSLNFHGEGAFHQEKYRIDRGYFADGIAEPQTWVFRRMLQNCLIAVRVLQAQIEADESKIGAMGLSQGGGMAIWTGAFSPIVRAVVADMPFLGVMPWALTRNAYRYPLKEVIDFLEDSPIRRQMVLNTLSYFDTMNVATRCRVPTLVSFGTKDPACRPETVEAIFQALAGPKELAIYDWGHDWHVDMIARNRDWFLQQLSGGPAQG